VCHSHSSQVVSRQLLCEECLASLGASVSARELDNVQHPHFVSIWHRTDLISNDNSKNVPKRTGPCMCTAALLGTHRPVRAELYPNESFDLLFATLNIRRNAATSDQTRPARRILHRDATECGRRNFVERGGHTVYCNDVYQTAMLRPTKRIM
jgi:hypothetical protein